jgi:DNA-binding NtrC family response regulator
MSDDAPQRPVALLLDNDLFFVTKVTETLKHAGYTTHTARRVEDFARLLSERRPEVALVNTAARGLDWREAIMAARATDTPVIAFGSHVDLETQEAARQAGATRVITNSKLASDLPGIVARAVRQSSATAIPGDEAESTTTHRRQDENETSE